MSIAQTGYAASSVPQTSTRAVSLWVLQTIALIFIAVKVAFIFTAGPSSDEAYYWVWGQHFDLSYFDHPPLNAWLLGLTSVFGRNLFSLRVMTLLTMAGTFAIYYFWVRRYAGEAWRHMFWAGLVIYLASPTFGLLGTVAFPDHLLVFLCLTAGYFFINVFAQYEKTGKVAVAPLYYAAFFLGLAALSKYAAGLMAIAVILVILFNGSYRGLLRSPHLYAAAALAIVMQAPVLIWNLQNGFASFQFHLVDRHGGGGWLSNPSLERIWEFPLTSLILISPFLVVAFVRFFLDKFEPGFERSAKRLAIWLFWVSTGLFLFVSLFDYVNFWWNLLAYVLVLPFAAKYLGTGLLFWGHVIYGAVVTGLLYVSMAVVPLINVFGGYDWRLSPLYGWEEFTPVAAEVIHGMHPDFIASSDPGMTSFVAYSLWPNFKTTPFTNIGTDPSQYDYWFDREARAGDDALVVLDSNVDPATVSGEFEKFNKFGDSLTIERFGLPIRTFDFYYGEDYAPTPRP